jgi:hypothetical protein
VILTKDTVCFLCYARLISLYPLYHSVRCGLIRACPRALRPVSVEMS